MLAIQKLIPRGQGLAKVLLKRATTIELDWDVRQKSRFDATDSAGRHLGIFLSRGSVVRGGDVLVAEDGSMVLVKAAPQPVLEVRACAQHGSPFDLLRAAYHLGNRHVPLELQPDHLKLEPDHVLAEMLRRMHLIVTAVEAAFEPEGGAYGAAGSAHAHGGSHGHDHAHDHSHGHGHDGGHDDGHGHEHAHAHSHAGHASHDHDHDHDHDHSHGHGHSHAHVEPHVHGPGCGHDHSHDHAHGHAHSQEVKAAAKGVIPIRDHRHYPPTT